MHVSGAAGGEVVDNGVIEPDGITADEETPPDEIASELAEAGGNLPDADPRPLFSELGLSEPIVRAVEEKGYLHPTPIQEQAIPYVLMGRDVLGVAQTGTGKTAGFTLPLLEILADRRARARMPRSLILEPTRELALQVAENFVDYGRHLKLTHALLIGGESMSDQRDALDRGVDVLIATPGRLLDLFERGGLLLNDTRILVIDEADRMLDMGFIPDVERIVSLVSPMRQTLFFSATMAPEIRRLADAFLRNPKEISVTRSATVASNIEAGLVLVDEPDKRRALRALLRRQELGNALIFCNRKRDVDILTRSLVKHGFSAGALHGDLAQSVRFATLERFKAGEIQLLVCSDVAARGIDIGGLSHVFNFDVPIHSEDYVHRIGRTGRAGRSGRAITVAGPEDRLLVDAIERLIGAPIPRMAVEGVDTAEWAEIDPNRRRRGGRGGRASRPDERREPSRPADRRGGAPEGREPQNRRGRDPVERGERQPRRDAEPVRPAHAPERDRGRDRDRERGRRDRTDASSARQPWRGRDDLGPPVTGFGGELPGFMLLPRRDRTDGGPDPDGRDEARVLPAPSAPPPADRPGSTTQVALAPFPAATATEPVVVHIPVQEAPPPEAATAPTEAAGSETQPESDDEAGRETRADVDPGV